MRVCACVCVESAFSTPPTPAPCSQIMSSAIDVMRVVEIVNHATEMHPIETHPCGSFKLVVERLLNGKPGNILWACQASESASAAEEPVAGPNTVTNATMDGPINAFAHAFLSNIEGSKRTFTISGKTHLVAEPSKESFLASAKKEGGRKFWKARRSSRDSHINSILAAVLTTLERNGVHLTWRDRRVARTRILRGRARAEFNPLVLVFDSELEISTIVGAFESDADDTKKTAIQDHCISAKRLLPEYVPTSTAKPHFLDTVHSLVSLQLQTCDPERCVYVDLEPSRVDVPRMHEGFPCCTTESQERGAAGLPVYFTPDSSPPPGASSDEAQAQILAKLFTSGPVFHTDRLRCIFHSAWSRLCAEVSGLRPVPTVLHAWPFCVGEEKEEGAATLPPQIAHDGSAPHAQKDSTSPETLPTPTLPANAIRATHPDVCANTPCTKESKSRCGRCKRERYCGSECQKSHWLESHRGVCVKADDGEGVVRVND